MNPPKTNLGGFKKEVNSLKAEFDEKLNALHESLEARYIDFIDTNAVMVKSDLDLSQRINAVEQVVLDLEETKESNNTKRVTPEMIGKLNGEFTGKIDGLTMQIRQGTASTYCIVARGFFTKQQ